MSALDCESCSTNFTYTRMAELRHLEACGWVLWGGGEQTQRLQVTGFYFRTPESYVSQRRARRPRVKHQEGSKTCSDLFLSCTTDRRLHYAGQTFRTHNWRSPAGCELLLLLTHRGFSGVTPRVSLYMRIDDAMEHIYRTRPSPGCYYRFREQNLL